MAHKKLKKALHAGNAPNKCLNKPQRQGINKMILQNHSTLFRTWFGLPFTLHLSMACFKCDIYFEY